MTQEMFVLITVLQKNSYVNLDLTFPFSHSLQNLTFLKQVLFIMFHLHPRNLGQVDDSGVYMYLCFFLMRISWRRKTMGEKQEYLY